MLITDIQKQVKNKKRMSIFIDDEYSFSANVNVVYDFGLCIGMEIDEELIHDIKFKDGVIRAYSSALRGSITTEFAMRNKLSAKEYSKDVIDEVIDRLKEYDYINDDEYVKNYIQTHIQKYGEKRIRLELYKKGINLNQYDFMLSECRNSEYEMCKNLAQKKLYSIGDIQKDKKYNKIASFLQMRGYSYSVIKEVLEDLEISRY